MIRGTLISPTGIGLWEIYSFIYLSDQPKAELTICRTFCPKPYLNFYMRQICIVSLAFVIQWHADFSFSTVSEFCSHDPFIVIKELTVRFQADNVILFQCIEL